MLNSADERLSRARSLLERAGVAQRDLLPPEISASWKRCLDTGLDPHKPAPLEEIDALGLAAARDRADLTRRLALAEMQALYQQIAGSNFLIAFADRDGVLLDTIADQSFRAAAKTANAAARLSHSTNLGRCSSKQPSTAARGASRITASRSPTISPPVS